MRLKVDRGVSLKPYNSLQIDVVAEHFVCLSNFADCAALPALIGIQPLLMLGGGSNVVLTQDVPGVVLLNRLRGITVLTETPDAIEINVAGGENWDALVHYSIERGWFGLENLSAIPGTVGAAPVQNIGAYGVELKDLLLAVEVFDLRTGQGFWLERSDCDFGYRDSVFKHQLKDSHLITQVRLRLNKQPDLVLDYGEIRKEVAAANLDLALLTPLQLRNIIIAVRARKLPDPAQLPNAGSFFKNPVIPLQQLQQLLQHWPTLVWYAVGTQHAKIAAGWMIEQLGWKGQVAGKVRVHEHQALVLVNQGGSGTDVVDLAHRIQADVVSRFGVELEIEPRIIGLAP